MGTTHWHPDIELWNTVFILSLYHGSTMLYPYKSVKNWKAPSSFKKKMCSHELKWLQIIIKRNWYFQFLLNKRIIKPNWYFPFLLNKRLTFHLLFCKWYAIKRWFFQYFFLQRVEILRLWNIWQYVAILMVGDSPTGPETGVLMTTSWCVKMAAEPTLMTGRTATSARFLPAPWLQPVSNAFDKAGWQVYCL